MSGRNSVVLAVEVVHEGSTYKASYFVEAGMVHACIDGRSRLLHCPSDQIPSMVKSLLKEHLMQLDRQRAQARSWRPARPEDSQSSGTMVELSLEKLNELINAIYAAALDPDEWQSFVRKLSFWADGAQVVMQGHDFVANRPLVEIAMNLPPEFLHLYKEHYAATNVWVPGIARMQVGAAGVPEAFLAREVLFETEYYNDWLRPMELGTAAGVVLQLNREGPRWGGEPPGRCAPPICATADGSGKPKHL